ncbi:hypothetical protein ACOME3_003139 [Neoechinorhynchus agilis]
MVSVHLRILTDVHLNISDTSNRLADGCCDSSIALYRKALEFIESMDSSDASYLLLGDFCSHKWPGPEGRRTKSKFEKTMKMYVEMTLKYVAKNASIFPVIGNHDQHPSIPITDYRYYARLLNECQWRKMIRNQEIESQFLKGGYYRVRLSSK